jgi:hypothetical protein
MQLVVRVLGIGALYASECAREHRGAPPVYRDITPHFHI